MKYLGITIINYHRSCQLVHNSIYSIPQNILRKILCRVKWSTNCTYFVIQNVKNKNKNGEFGKKTWCIYFIKSWMFFDIRITLYIIWFQVKTTLNIQCIDETAQCDCLRWADRFQKLSLFFESVRTSKYL